MKYILLVIIMNGGAGGFSTEFNTLEACENAGKKVYVKAQSMEFRAKIFTKCVIKGKAD